MNSNRKRKLKVAIEFTLFTLVVICVIVGLSLFFVWASATLPEVAVYVMLGLLFLACVFGWGYING